MGCDQKYVVVCAAVAVAIALCLARPSAASPNILLIMSDDAGWADFGFNELGNGEIPTPALDSIAARGVRFSAAYTSQVCSVSRARIFLGQHPQRSGYQDNAPDSTDASDDEVEGLRLEDVTMFERLRDAGYHTAYFGKWHLGMERDIVEDGTLVTPGNLPPRHGLDYFLGVLNGTRQYFMGSVTGFGNTYREQTLDTQTGLVVDTNREGDWPAGAYFTDVLAGSIADHISQRAGDPQPFFIVASFTAPHSPLQATQEYLDQIDALSPGLTGNRRLYGAMMLALDAGVRTILDRLDDPDQDGDPADSISADTLICFINDNGGQTGIGAINEPLRGKKGETWDGGIRVPMLLAGPGVPDTGAAFDDPVDSVDLVPTFLAAAGAPVPAPDQTDGVDLLPYLAGDLPGPPHPHLYVRGVGIEKVGVRRDRFKLTTTINSGPLLFDIVENIDERGRLDDDLPEVVTELLNIVYAYEAEYPKPRWGDQSFNVFDEFVYRAQQAGPGPWSAPFSWTPEGGTGQASLRTRDGFAEFVARFPTSPTPYTATNDMERPNEMLMLINAIEFVGSHDEADSGATIDGLPLLFVDSLDGAPARVGMLAGGAGVHPFEIALEVRLFDDLVLDGEGTQPLILSAGVVEQRIGRSVTRSGAWPLEIRAPVEVSGTVELQSGPTTVAPAGRIDAPVITVAGAATLTLTDGGAPITPDFLADDAAVEIDHAGGPPVALDFDGAETVAGLTVAGEALAAGDYGAKTHPLVLAGTGVLRVVPTGTCNAADLAPPFGTLDLTDINAFAGAFLAGELPADIDGNGLLDLTDITTFVNSFLSGCP